MELTTESVNGHYLVSRPSTGAVSLFSPAEYLVFMCISESQGQDPELVIRRVMLSYGCTDDQVHRFTGVFLKKLEQQGWMRTQREDVDTQSVQISLAPTLHTKNLHEVADIARFAVENGGVYAPNHLRHFPHAPHAGEVSLSPGELRNSIIRTFRDVKPVEKTESDTGDRCGDIREARQQARCRYVCGNAWYSVDVDWNGDVHPCHLLREKEFILGNLAAEDEFCEILYKFEVDKLFRAKNIHHW